MAAGKKAVDILYSVPNLNVQKLAYKKWNVSQNVLQTNTNGDFILRQVLRPKFWHHLSQLEKSEIYLCWAAAM